MGPAPDDAAEQEAAVRRALDLETWVLYSLDGAAITRIQFIVDAADAGRAADGPGA